MASKPHEEFGSILSTANTALKIFADPVIQSNTSSSDFTVEELMFGRHPVSLYLIVNPQDGERLAPLTRIFFDFVAKKLFSYINPASPDYKHKMLLLIDEFTSLGRMEFFEQQLAYFAGYGIRCLFICQSFSQLYKVYGRETSILSNCHSKVLLGAADVNDAKLVAEYLGKETVVSYSQSRSNRGGLDGGSESESKSMTGRSLMTPDEILRMPYDRIIILQMGRHPYYAKKIMYYLDDRFSRHARLPVITKSLPQQELKALPYIPVLPAPEAEPEEAPPVEDILPEAEEDSIMLEEEPEEAAEEQAEPVTPAIRTTLKLSDLMETTE
jgi:type IV secretion system protein VirD4